MMRVAAVLTVLAFVLVGCNEQTRLSDLLNGPEVDFGKSLFTALRARQLDVLKAMMDPKVLETAPPSTWERMADLFPEERARSVHAVGVNLVSLSGDAEAVRRASITIEYEFDHKWLLASTTWRESLAGARTIEGMHLSPLASSLEEINRFTLQGKSARNYLFLSLAVTLPLLNLAALIFYLRSSRPWPRKILSSIGVLLSFGQITLNWTTGAISITPLYLQVLAAGWVHPGPAAPYFVTLSIPVFAILSLWAGWTGKIEPPVTPSL